MRKIVKNNKLRLIFSFLISVIAGSSMLISPDTVSHWVIRGVGIVWIIEGISFLLDFIVLFLEEKKANSN